MVGLTTTRRKFAALCAGAIANAQTPNLADAVIATPTQDATPRVGIVLSSFAGGQEHDGTALPGLASPKPNDADLDDDFIDIWVRKAIEFGSPRANGLSRIVAPDDWVVIKTDISHCYGMEGYLPGSVTDPRIVRAVIGYLLDHKCAARITIAEGASHWQPIEKSKTSVDGWTTHWGGAYGGLSYRKMVEEFSRKYPSVRFDLADLNFSGSIELPVPGGGTAKRNTSGVYTIAKMIQQCDKLISIAPLKTDARTRVALTFNNYYGIASGAKYGFPKTGLMQLGKPEEVMVDLFNYHPADYCVLGGSFGIEGTGQSRATVHHNVLIAGTKAVSVDAVAAAIMGFAPAQVPYLPLAEKSGSYGVLATDGIWTRGNDMEQARRCFRAA